MTSLPAALMARLCDGVARLAADGSLTPCNDAMRTICARAAAGAAGPVTLATLGVDAERAAELRAGECVHAHARDASHELRLVCDGGTDWLVATDVAAGERAAASMLEGTRLRALANAASGVVHDLNNLLNAALGLAAQLDPLVRDAADRRLLQELGRGTRQGAQLLRAIARLLSRPPRDRAAVPVATIVEEAVALAAKPAAALGVPVHVDAATEPVVARTVAAEAVQALWHGAMTALEHGPRRLVVASDRHTVQLAPARTRAWARVRLHAAGLTPAAAREIAALVEGEPGLLASSLRSSFATGLAAASFAQRRLGGDLAVRANGDGVELEYRWPAAT